MDHSLRWLLKGSASLKWSVTLRESGIAKNKKNPTKGWQPLGVCKVWVSDVAAVPCEHLNCHGSILLALNCYCQQQTFWETLFTLIPPQIQEALDPKNTSVVGEGRKGDREWLLLWAAWAEEQLSWKVFKLSLASIGFTGIFLGKNLCNLRKLWVFQASLGGDHAFIQESANTQLGTSIGETTLVSLAVRCCWAFTAAAWACLDWNDQLQIVNLFLSLSFRFLLL